MNDRQAQFRIMVGDACQAAALGRLEIELHTDDGDVIAGIPSAVRSQRENESVMETGYFGTVHLGGRPTDLARVTKCVLRAP